MRPEQRRLIPGRSLGVLILFGVIACVVSGCYGPDYGYSGYPDYGYAPYSYGWGGYDPVFVEHHPWEDHHDDGHHTEFYHGGGAEAHEGGGFHAEGGGFHGGGGGFHGGGGGGGHGGGGGGGHR